MIARGVVLDSSAVVAMMTREDSAMSLTEQLEVIRPRLISAGTVLEVSLVLQQRFGEAADLLVDDFLHAFSVEVVAFDAAQLRMARDAARRFGRGRHRAARPTAGRRAASTYPPSRPPSGRCRARRS